VKFGLRVCVDWEEFEFRVAQENIGGCWWKVQVQPGWGGCDVGRSGVGGDSWAAAKAGQQPM
jgi:hypothetical protein